MRPRHGIVAILFLGALAPVPARAQTAPPGTDIYLVELSAGEDGPAAGAPTNLTRRPGYDNQPNFTPDGAGLFYTSIRDGQADIYRYDLGTASIARVTRTPESEYSPTLVPGGGALSVVRVEADSTQRLWRFPLDGGAPSVLLPDVAPVGYHAWAEAGVVALFVLGAPATLRLAALDGGDVAVLAENIGRSLHRIPGRDAISFVHKVSDDVWWITELDPDSRRTRRLVRTLPGREDFAWLPDGSLLMTRGSKLYRWDPAGNAEWRELADFTAAGIRDITRIAVSPRGDRIALVGADGG